MNNKQKLFKYTGVAVLALSMFACSDVSNVSDITESVSTVSDRDALKVLSEKKLQIQTKRQVTEIITDFSDSSSKEYVQNKIKQTTQNRQKSYTLADLQCGDVAIPSNLIHQSKQYELNNVEDVMFWYDGNTYTTASYSNVELSDTEMAFNSYSVLYNTTTCEVEFKNDSKLVGGTDISFQETITNSLGNDILKIGMSCPIDYESLDLNCILEEKGANYEIISEYDMELMGNAYTYRADAYFEEKNNWDVHIQLDDVMFENNCEYDSEYNYICESTHTTEKDYATIQTKVDSIISNYYTPMEELLSIELSEENPTAMFTIYTDQTLQNKVAKATINNDFDIEVYMYDENGVLETSSL